MSDETKRLIVLAQSGDKEAANALVEQNIGLIKSTAKRFYGRAEPDDLFQIGAMGLVKAISRFDVDYGVEFSTYAVPMIIGEIKRYLRDDGIIKVGRAAKENAAKIRRLGTERGDCTLREIAQELNISYEDALYSLEATQAPDSLDRCVGEGQNAPSMAQLVADKVTEEDTLTAIALKEAISSLGEKERQLILLRYYKEFTQSKTAQILGVSQVQVSRLEKKIMSEMKKRLAE